MPANPNVMIDPRHSVRLVTAYAEIRQVLDDMLQESNERLRFLVDVGLHSPHSPSKRWAAPSPTRTSTL